MNIAARNANYTRTINTTASPERVFQALTGEMDRWWTTETEGALARVGDRIRVDFPPNNGHWVFQAVTLSAGACVELTCIDAHHVVAGQPAEIDKEWLGTTLRWEISAEAEGTKVAFEHQGLTPALHCYDICDEGWGYFFATSFAAYLDKGTGMPHSPA